MFVPKLFRNMEDDYAHLKSPVQFWVDLIHAGISRAVARHGPQTVLPLNYAGPHGELAGG